jgi:hypothetical protein
MKLRPFGFALAWAALAAPSGWAASGQPAVVLSQPIHATGATVEVSLHGADAATLAQTLGSALGGTVRIEGIAAAPVTLDLTGVTAHAALDAVARALYGTWRPVYSVSAGAAPAGAPHPVPLGRKVTANLTNVSAHAAFALVARAGGGTLELPPGLDKNLSLVANDLPVEQALDELAKQAGAAWSVTYLFKPGVAPPSPTRPQPAPAPTRSAPRSGTPPPGMLEPGERLPGGSLSERRSFPAPGTGENAAKMLALGLTQVMKMPPAQRQSAVKDFALQLDQQFRQMQLLPPPRRLEQMTAMRPVYQAALRTYNGLVPAQRREFQPIIDVFNRWLR